MTKIITKLDFSALNLQENEEQNILLFLTQPQTQQTININLNGKGASIKLHCLIIGTKDQNYPLTINLNHHSPHTSSKVIVNSAMFNNSNITFHGNINIPENSSEVVTDLKHQSLILSPKAKTTTIPSLEIKNPNVQASHSATIGNVDQNLIFYLTSRGLSRPQATELLIKSFLQQDLPQHTKEKVEKLIQDAIY